MTKSSTLRTCRICGCSENAACSYMTAWGRANCYWASENLCGHPHCLDAASWRLCFEAMNLLWAACGVLEFFVLRRHAFPLALMSVAIALLLFWWADNLRENRLRGKKGDNPLGSRRDWAFWAAIVAIIVFGAVGIQIAANRLPAALARARAMQVQTARPAGGAR